MSREVPQSMLATDAAASSGTTYLYFPISVPFRLEGYAWNWVGSEADTDDTVNFTIDRDIDLDGSFDNASDALMAAPANPAGCADTKAAGGTVINKNGAASGGAAAATNALTPVRLAAGETIRVGVVRVSSGTGPAVNFMILGKHLQPIV